MEKIKLSQNKGPVVFLGGVNAMPMMYALELRKRSIDVVYVVDRPQEDMLSRPENHYPDIGYPYPDWIIEKVLSSQIFLPLFPRLFARWIEGVVRKVRTTKPQAIVLNGFFCSLAPYLWPGQPKIFLPGGSDLDSWADVEGQDVLSETFSGRSIFKYIPFPPLRKNLVKYIVGEQFKGASHCDAVMYFPRGFNAQGDRVLEQLENLGVKYVPRYDISFEPLKYEKRGITHSRGKLVIFSGVRFLFKTFPDGNEGYGKGNDLIIKGLAKYHELNKNIEIHFIEKGEDVASAKALCSEYGLDDVTIWHKEMKFADLLSLYRLADICFDQIGSHWIGAIGFYALWLGKPLIANDLRVVDLGIWPNSAPILSANNAEGVLEKLKFIENFDARLDMSRRAMEFSDKNLGPDVALRSIFEIDV